MRWLLLLVSALGFAVAFKSGTPGLLALSLFVAFGSLVASFLGFAAARIESQAETQTSRAATLVALSRGKVAATGHNPVAATTPVSPGDGAQWTPVNEGRDDHRGHQHGHGHDHGHHHGAADSGDSPGGGSGGGDSGGGGDGGGGSD